MLARKVFSASAWLVFGRLFVKGADALAAIVIARFITPDAFGVVMLAVATLMMMRAFTELPVSDALIRESDLTAGHIDTAFTLNVLRGLLLAILMIAAAWPLSMLYSDERLFALLLALALVPLVLGLRSPMMVTFVRDVNYVPVTVLEAVAKFVATGLGLTTAVIWESYWAIVVTMVVPPIITTPVSYILAPYRPRFGLSRARDIVSFAGWVTVGRFFATANGEADRFFIGGIIGTAAVGYFSMARSIATLASWAIGAPLVQALYPGFSRVQEDSSRLNVAYLRSQALVFAALAPLGVGIALVAEPFVLLILGEQWKAAIILLQILAPAGAIAALGMPAQALVMAINKPKRLAIRDGAIFFLAIPIIILAAYFYGLVGAACARLFLTVPVMLISLRMVSEELGPTVSVRNQLANSWRTALSLAAMTAAVVCASTFLGNNAEHSGQLVSIFGFGALGGIIYVATHITMWKLSGSPQGPETFFLEMISNRLHLHTKFTKGLQ